MAPATNDRRVTFVGIVFANGEGVGVETGVV